MDWATFWGIFHSVVRSPWLLYVHTYTTTLLCFPKITYTLAGLEPRPSVPPADAMTTEQLLFALAGAPDRSQFEAGAGRGHPRPNSQPADGWSRLLCSNVVLSEY
jgi:hypothetical protein